MCISPTFIARLMIIYPFVSFIIPYLLWFLYVAVSLVYLFFQTKHLDDFYRCCAVLLLGMTTSLLIYTIFPNQQTMRPKTFDHSNIFTTIIDILYRTDTDTNVFPSIHVFNSIAIHFGISRSYYFRNVDDVNIVKNDKKEKRLKSSDFHRLYFVFLSAYQR